MRHITPVDTKHHHILERFAGIDPVRLLRQGYRTRVLTLEYSVCSYSLLLQIQWG
jgi:hypothetical protein